MPDSTMICSSCQEPKYKLEVVKSKLFPTRDMYICATCREAGYEPRHFVILACQSYGPQITADYVKNHKYCGETITLKEVVK